jgi:hypothetical protein
MKTSEKIQRILFMLFLTPLYLLLALAQIKARQEEQKELIFEETRNRAT